jgi:AbrB family looped-hinge helix DNA binding protein
MRVTTKGQVTIPQEIREKLNIAPATEVDFIVGDDDRVYLVKREDQTTSKRFEQLRGSATVRMTTEEIMALTRSES